MDDVVALKQVSDTISLYSAENLTEDVGIASVWEAHKAVVRGELISQGSRLKKATEGELHSLLTKIHSSELLRKRRTTPELTAELHLLRQELALLLNTRIQARLRHLSHKFYEFSNKCRRLLARALRRQRTLDHIHKLHTAAGHSVIHSSKIADTF